jgi:hypothetical protein
MAMQNIVANKRPRGIWIVVAAAVGAVAAAAIAYKK